MRTRTLLILMVLAAFLATSCDQGLFGTNFFGAFESYDAPDYQSASSADLVKASEDDRFFEEMSEEEAAVVVAKLEVTYTDTNLPDDERADAALLAADVYIKTSAASETMTVLNGIVGDAINGTTPDFQDSTFISTLFSDDATELAGQLEALAGAADALAAYGGLLGTDSTLSTQDDNPGDTATLALVGGVVKALLSENGDDPAAVAAALINDPASLNPPVGADLNGILGPNLVNVIEAGIGSLADLGF